MKQWLDVDMQGKPMEPKANNRISVIVHQYSHMGLNPRATHT
jgi:hypothetical protein